MGLPNEKIANEVYDVLVMCGGALPDDRNQFIYAHLKDGYPCDEYRFGGYFGFGGKFYSHMWEHSTWHIGYHPDDVKGKNEELYHSLMVAMNTLLLSIWEKWKMRGKLVLRDGAEQTLPSATLALPDAGENAVEVELLIPSGEKVTVSYVAYTGNMDVCVYAPQDGSDKRAPGAPEFAPKRVPVTCWIDEVDIHGHYVSSMHPAPPWHKKHDHQRLATQIVLSVGPNHDEVFPEKEGE